MNTKESAPPGQIEAPALRGSPTDLSAMTGSTTTTVGPIKKKRGNPTVREQYDIVLDDGNAEQTKYRCRHCKKKTYAWAKFNSARANDHLGQCNEVPADVRASCREGSQAAKRTKKLERQASTAHDGSIASESTATLGAAHAAGASAQSSVMDRILKANRQTQMTTHYGAGYKPEDFRRIIRVNVESMLKRFEPLDRLQDQFVQEALAGTLGNRLILHYIPQTTETLYKQYVVPIDNDATAQIKAILAKTPGNATLAVDGVTVHGRSHLLYTLSKGVTTVFMKSTQLQSLVHTTSAEVMDGVDKIEYACSEYNTTVTNIAVDNAARKVMEEVIKKYGEKFPEASPIVATRDPEHCIDLLSKDSANTIAMANILRKASAIISFVKIDKIAGMLEEMLLGKEIKFVPKAQHWPETRFHLACDSLLAVIKQRPFIDVLRTKDKYVAYYSASRPLRKASMDEAIDSMTVAFCDEMEVAHKWFLTIKNAAMIVAADDFPLSGYLPVVQGMRNGLNAVLNDSYGGRSFQTVLGDNARRELVEMVTSRFNMSGADPMGRKVGLLDQNQVWAFLVDPFKNRLHCQLFIDGGIDQQVRAMVNFFLKKEGNLDEPSHSNLIETVIDEWKELNNQEGRYAANFPGPAPAPKSTEELLEQQKTLTLQQVCEWVTSTNRHPARLRFFSTLSRSVFIEKVAKTLLSIRSTGSIAVERVAKPLKNKVMTKARNQLDVAKQETLLRVGLNLENLRKANLVNRPV
jgi:hypothetical protein